MAVSIDNTLYLLEEIDLRYLHHVTDPSVIC